MTYGRRQQIRKLEARRTYFLLLTNHVGHDNVEGVCGVSNGCAACSCWVCFSYISAHISSDDVCIGKSNWLMHVWHELVSRTQHNMTLCAFAEGK